MVNELLVRNALMNVYDPELGINIVDLGLVYGIDINDANVVVTMTMTTPHCPLTQGIRDGIPQALLGIEGIKSVDVNLVWEPPWSPNKMSEEAKQQLGFG